MGVKVAVDAMGGDNAPREVVRGAVDTARCGNGPERIILVGRSREITEELEACGISLGADGTLELREASQVAEMGEAPAIALRRKRDASIMVAARLLRSREAEALVTAGNTGAAMAASWLLLDRTDGIERPALAAFLPTLKGRTIMLDVGANVDCSPRQLVQFALMGSDCARRYLGLARPSVGILSNGRERGKGNRATVEAASQLEEIHLSEGIDFVGNIEGNEIPDGMADVLVTDGFVGNAVLKAAEGAVEAVFSTIPDELEGGWSSKLCAFLLAPSLLRLKARFRSSTYGGAMLLGVEAPVVIAHGSSDSRTVRSAIEFACVCAAGGNAGSHGTSTSV